MTTLHLHAPLATAKNIVTGTCPDCKKRTRFLAFFTPWYGDHQTCLRCGREWIDGQWMALDFMRGVRKVNIENARRKWRAMPPCKDNHYGAD